MNTLFNKKFFAGFLAALILGAVGLFAYNQFKTPEKPQKTEKDYAENEKKPNEINPSENAPKESSNIKAPTSLPNFISTIRTYSGGGIDEFQVENLKELGYTYIQGFPNGMQWPLIEPKDDTWKWTVVDAQMDMLDRAGIKTIPHLMLSKNVASVPWDESIGRENPIALREYEEYAYEITNRYKNRPSWSGIVAVWGGSADVWDREYAGTDPETVMPLLNAAYDGIKRADPNTIVVGFNFATTAGTQSEWEEYHRRAFAMNPKFDWYGIQSHGLPPTMLSSKNKYAGMQGLVNVRKFLNNNGYGDKPIWLNEGGYYYDDQGQSPQIHAEQIIQTYLMGGAMPINLKGWVYFGYFDKSHDGDMGTMAIMTSLDQDNPPQPRLAWNAIKTLLTTVRFQDYIFESQLSGGSNSSAPYVYRFQKNTDFSYKLWAVFLPRLYSENKNEPTRAQAPASVSINIGENKRATVIEMLGSQKTVQADASGNIEIQASSAPIYIKVDN